MFNQPGSRRWTHFHSALQLAIQRSAHKWTFEDFAECFPLYVEEEKNGSSAVFNAISGHMESQTYKDFEELFNKYDVHTNIDILHTVVNEAIERKKSGNVGKDVWKEDLEPRVAVCARTIPVLEATAKKLRESLAAAVAENTGLQSQMEENIRAYDQANDQALEILDKVDNVYEEWLKLPLDEIEAWTVQTAESTKPTQRS